MATKPKAKPKKAKPRPATAIADRPLRLEYRSPAELAENPKNWRRHPESQLAALTDVIAEVGWAGVCLFNEATGRLLDGHARKKVAVDQGVAEVPVLIGSWTEAQERLILATFDPISAQAEADPEMLARLLEGLETESAAIEALIASLRPLPKPGSGGDEFDATPIETGPTRSAVGDLWIIGGSHRLLVDSCESTNNIDRLFAGQVPSIMVTDPPYGVKYDPKWRHKCGINKSNRTGSVANDDRAEWSAVWRLFPGNVVYVWHGALHGSTVFDSLVAAGFVVRAQLVWVKPRLVLSRGHYHWQHEPVLVADRPAGANGDPDDEASIDGELAYYGVRKGGSASWRGGRKQTTVWEIGFAGETQTHHGTQKPIECMARPIRNHGAEGDIVFDPFLGSGTTLIAAHRLNRVCYGCEIEPRYADVILKRAEAEGLTCEKAVG